MRRTLLTLGGTVAGLAALLSFKTHSLASADPAPASPAASASASPSAAGAMGSGKAGSTPKAGKTSKASSGKTLTVAGTVANTEHGPMQVQLTLAGTKITKVTLLQRTNDGAESDQIDATAIPKLTSETLAAQSAEIDAVSGATYTSSGYIQSLQSALDKAGR
jgi:uncharacterized protein with FMN-binding domain